MRETTPLELTVMEQGNLSSTYRVNVIRIKSDYRLNSLIVLNKNLLVE